MFGIDFPEFVVIAVVALIVLGPERLPKAARFAGLWVRRARSQWNSVKNELERELAADELKRHLHDAQTAMRDVDNDVRAADAQARGEFDALRKATTGASAAMTPDDRRDAGNIDRKISDDSNINDSRGDDERAILAATTAESQPAMTSHAPPAADAAIRRDPARAASAGDDDDASRA